MDLRKYALKNGLRDLAAQVEVTLRTARIEIAAAERTPEDDEDEPDDEDAPPRGRPN